ncbi:MAG: 4a-hydroxytetrahydrobiopterin dehydratase [Planctomycetota bacterium]|jgi:4a-hydroxytetrahydrobiopterin dehydratase
MCEKNCLLKSQCIPCQGGVEPLKGKVIAELLKQLAKDWQVIDEHHLEKEYRFRNFKQSLEFVNKVGELAEIQGHHPDIYLAWSRVRLIIWTHKIDGLHENDFILAAKADELAAAK